MADTTTPPAFPFRLPDCTQELLPMDVQDAHEMGVLWRRACRETAQEAINHYSLRLEHAEAALRDYACLMGKIPDQSLVRENHDRFLNYLSMALDSHHEIEAIKAECDELRAELRRWKDHSAKVNADWSREEMRANKLRVAIEQASAFLDGSEHGGKRDSDSAYGVLLAALEDEGK